MFPPLCLTLGFFLQVIFNISLPSNTAVIDARVEAKRQDSGFIQPQQFLPNLPWIFEIFTGKLKTGLHMGLIEQGDFALQYASL